MFRSIGLTELILIGLILLLLFGGRRIAQAGTVVGRQAKKKFLTLKCLWEWITGTEAEGLEAERKLGQAWAEEIERQSACAVDASNQALVERLGKRLCQDQASACPFRFQVLASPEINAIALSGGFVFVFEGLVNAFKADDDSVAFVLAHEMGHVLLGHARERFFRETALRILLSPAAKKSEAVTAFRAEDTIRHSQSHRKALLARFTGHPMSSENQRYHPRFP